MLLRNSPHRLTFFRAFTPLGVVCIGLSVLMGRLGDIFTYVHFVEGLFIGLGVTMATVGFIFEIKAAQADRN